MRIDSHQHFWHYSPTEHTWMTAEMEVLKHDFLPHDLKPLLTELHFEGCVSVQARQSLEETEWLLQLAAHYDFIQAVVGWVDLRSNQLTHQLEHLVQHPKFSGVRHVLQDEADDQFMLRPDFRRGIAQLQSFQLTYDLLLYPRHLKPAAQLVEEFPHQPFVLDHLAKPGIAAAHVSPWKEDLQHLAKFPNVSCKLSGMVTEANWQQWKPQDLHQYLDIAVAAFGCDRLMIGSDWPVCTLAAAYAPAMQVVIDYVQQFSLQEQTAILGENCARFYNITEPRPREG